MKTFSILLIDDEESILISLKSYLSKRNFKVFTANNGEDGIKIIKSNLIDLVITDYRMPGISGLEVLNQVNKINPLIDTIMITAYGSVEDAVQVMKSGAYDYLSKPIDLDQLDAILKKVCEKQLLQIENKKLKEELSRKEKLNYKTNFDSIISRSKKMEEVLNTVARVANSKATILIRGESGSGKELIAKSLHLASNRSDKPFVVVNVAALSENLLESELFGHEKGAFTGAVNFRIGRFEEANGGTLFIDEVGDIPLNVQVKLLRAIQFSEIQRLGSNESKKIDVRILAATHRNLEEMITSGNFREDLFYRLNVIPILIPPLRHRKEDIPALVDFFVKKYSSLNKIETKKISRDTLDYLMKYNFPGNIRELENVIERAVLLSRDEIITTEDLPILSETNAHNSLLDPFNLSDAYEEKVKTFEKTIIDEALKQTKGNKSAAARLLKITERHLRSRLERL